MTILTNEKLGPGEIASLPGFTRDFFEKDPKDLYSPLAEERTFRGAIVVWPIVMEMNKKLGNWRQRFEDLAKELGFKAMIVKSANEDEEKIDERVRETAAVLYTMGYELGLNKLQPPLINEVADRLMRQGVVYPQLQYRNVCAQIMIAGARGA